MKRLTTTAMDALRWAQRPCDAGPVCSICSQQHLALVATGECGHAMCEDCWGGWAVANLENCRWNKRTDLRCFAEGCREHSRAEVWQHASTRSEAVQALEQEFAFRRRLQSNELFPTAVQVECPQPGCLGLGYLGSDSIMCFVCEHQWSPMEASASGDASDTVEDLLARGAAKACPACSTPILKNGGCDHMTCRCGHEFYWTNLQPYGRSGAPAPTAPGAQAPRRPGAPAPQR